MLFQDSNPEEDSEVDDLVPFKPSDAAVFKVSSDEAGTRIDIYICARVEGASRASIQRLLTQNSGGEVGILVNGVETKANYKVRVNDVIDYRPIPPTESRAFPEDIPIDVIYEDSSLLVINKARGMVVHPAPGSESGTLVNAVLAHCTDLSGIGGEKRPGIVHRLDKDTGGLLVVAKTDQAHQSLQQQIQAHTAERRYMVLVWGVPSFEKATIEAAIGRHPVDRKKMAVITDAGLTSRSAVTDIIRIDSYLNIFSLWEAQLHTGRTHQIRVHCAYAKIPVVGDPLYGGVRKLPANIDGVSASSAADISSAIDQLGGQALHAYSLAFDHPITGERLKFSAPIAPQMNRLLSTLDVARTQSNK